MVQKLVGVYKIAHTLPRNRKCSDPPGIGLRKSNKKLFIVTYQNTEKWNHDAYNQSENVDEIFKESRNF